MEEDPIGPSKIHQTMANSVEHSSRMLDHRTQRQIVDGIRREHKNAAKKRPAGHQRCDAGAPSDSELLGSMAARLALVERELLAAKREIIEKDGYIRQLEEKTVRLEELSCQKSSSSRDGHVLESKEREVLELKSLALQKQVDEMEVCKILMKHGP